MADSAVPLLSPQGASTSSGDHGSLFLSKLSKQDLLEQTEDHVAAQYLQTDVQTVLNAVNLYIGVGLLSTGYAVKLGGWASLGVLALCTVLFSWSAKLLCRAAQALPPGTLPSYPNIGKAAFGPPGQWIVMGAVLLEFWGAQGLCLIAVWQSIALLLPSHSLCVAGLCMEPRDVAVLGSAFVVVPAVLIPTFSRLTSVSLSGIVGSTLLCLVMVVTYLLDPSSSMVESDECHTHELVKWTYLPTAAGIFMVSLSGHAGLPSLQRSMKHPHHFERCIDATFLTMFLLYATMALFSYLYFGESLSILVTKSLNSSSSVAGVLLFKWDALSLSLSISQALTVMVALSVYSTIPPLVYVMAEMIVDLFERGRRTQQREFLEPAVRILVLLFGYLTAYLAYDILAHVESLVGGVFSIVDSLLLPAIIAYYLPGIDLPFWERKLLPFLIGLGVCASLGIFVKNVIELASSF